MAQFLIKQRKKIIWKFGKHEEKILFETDESEESENEATQSSARMN